MTVVKPQGRFGSVSLDNGSVTKFVEKPIGESGWINGGFFVLEPEIFSYINNDMTIWEREPLEKLADKNELSAYKHELFWQPMDTLRDMNYLNDLAQSKKIFPGMTLKTNFWKIKRSLSLVTQDLKAHG